MYINKVAIKYKTQKVNKTELCVMKGIIAIRNKSIIDDIANKCVDLDVFISYIIFFIH